MKSYQLKSICLLFLLNTVSCSGSKVIEFINDNMDFSDYESYRLVTYASDDTSISEDGMAFFNQIENTIHDNMGRKLFKKSNKPNLIVRYEIATSQRTETTNNTNYYDPYSYYRPARITSRNLTEGILLIEFRDRDKKKLVWQASIDLDYRRKNPTEVINNAVNQIFTTYPYNAGSNKKIIME